ncbi:carbohydrate-binding module family 5 protein, partial [Paxillus rubicundulus Ve08.2h10]
STSTDTATYAPSTYNYTTTPVVSSGYTEATNETSYAPTQTSYESYAEPSPTVYESYAEPSPTAYESYAEPSPTAWKRDAVNCNESQNWQEHLAYSAGDKVIFQNKLYTAKQWSDNNSPGTNPGQWNIEGECAQPINNKAECKGIDNWQNPKSYAAKDKVVYGEHLWEAQGWVQGNLPGGASGSWKDSGACEY